MRNEATPESARIVIHLVIHPGLKTFKILQTIFIKSSSKQGRAGAVTLAFLGRYLLVAPHEFLDQSDGSVCLW